MSYKKWLSLVGFFSFLGLSIVVIVNLLMDPYSQYKDSTYYIGEQRVILPGIAKKSDYNAIVLGTSMTENFSTNQIDDTFSLNTAKLSMSGGSLKEQNLIADVAFESGNDIKQVFWGLDFFKFNIKDYNYNSSAIEEYLIDYNYFNDYKYLLSLNTLKKSLDLYTFENRGSSLFGTQFYNMNDLGNWANNYTYSKDVVVENYYNYYDNPNASKEFLVDPEETISKYIEPLIVNNPETQFNLMITPPSVLYYKIIEQVNVDSVNQINKIRSALVNELSKYKNVDIYDFSYKKDWTNNLDLYKDISHYHESVNGEIIELISKERFLLNETNIEVINKEFKMGITEFILE